MKQYYNHSILEAHSYHDFPEQDTINKLIERQTEITPHSVALFYAGNQWTYSEINSLANRLAHFFLEKGNLEKSDRVVVCLEKSAILAVATLSIFKCRAVFIPADPNWPLARIERLLEDVKPKAVITSKPFTHLFSKCKSLFFVEELTHLVSTYSNENLRLSQTGRDLSYLIYSSGTTGKPKGVLGEHRHIISRFAWSWHDFPFKQDDICVFAPAFATIESLWVMFGSLAKGIPLVIPSENEQKNILSFVELLRFYHITRIELIPSSLKLLLHHYPDLLTQLPQLTLWDISGEILDRQTVLQFFSSGPSDARVNLINRMGASEASSFLFHKVNRKDLDREKIPVGKPTTNTTIYVLDSSLNPVEKGQTGELYVTGPRVVRGYFDDDFLTDQKFLKNPFKNSHPHSDRLYKTGDLVRENENGSIEYLGRQDFQIKVRGFRVNLNEIEELLKEHPRVADVVVLALEKNGKTNLTAFIVSNGDFLERQCKEALALRKFLIAHLPLFSIPNEFVFLEKFPITRAGKIDRLTLRTNEYTPVQPQSDYVPPTNEMEKVICKIWQDVLGYDQIGIDDEFSQLDGDSIKCAKILIAIQDIYPTTLLFSEIFAVQTIRKLAFLIKQKGYRETKECMYFPNDFPENLIPLSSSQKQLLFLHETQQNQALYHLFSCFEIKGSFNVKRFKEALKTLCEEQVLLRTKLVRFKSEEYFEVQSIESMIDLEISQITHVNEIHQHILHPFDFYKGPLFRVRLFELNGKWMVLFVIHHIIADEWSLQILHRRISNFYKLKTLSILNEDQIDTLRQDCLKKTKGSINFWKHHLEGASSTLALPYDFPRPKNPNFYGSGFRIEISKRLSGKIYSFLNREKGTLFTTILTALQLFLHKWTGQHDLNIGIPCTTREGKKLTEIMGYFVNALPTRSIYRPSQTLQEAHKKLQLQLFQIKEHQDISFNQITSAVSKQGSLNINPLYQVWFSIEDVENYEKLKFEGAAIKPVEISYLFSKFDLSFVVKLNNGHLFIDVEYSAELFKEETIKQLTERWVIFLENLFSNPFEKLSTISLLYDGEEQKLVQKFTNKSSLQLEYVEQSIQKIAQTSPDRIAIVDSQSRLSYACLNHRSNSIAHYFRSLLPSQSIVAVSLKPSIFLIELLVGLMKAGMCFLPIDTRTPDDRIAFLLNQSKASILVSDKIKEMPKKYFIFRSSEIETHLKSAESLNALYMPETARSYVIFTSGSTGEPKGVVVTRGNLANAILHLNDILEIDPNSRFLLNTMISFDIFLLELFAPLTVGGTVVIPPSEILFDGKTVGAFIKAFDINYLQATPSNWKLLLEGNFPRNPHLNLLTGGEKIESTLADKLLKIGKNLWNLYGPTETTIWSSFKKMTSDEPISVGKPLGNTSIYILNSLQQLLPPGVIGEIAIGGKGIAEGYLNQPHFTAEKYICSAHSVFDTSIIYRTGDKGYIDSNGEIKCLGRDDRQVKIHGHRIELNEIEYQIQKCELVHFVYVTTYIDHGEINEIVAYIEPDAKLNILNDEIEKVVKALLMKTLPSYMHPTLFIFLKNFPLTPNKKIDYKELPSPVLDRKINPDFILPETELEKFIADAWTQTLGIKNISIRDNFFGIGGHSLNAMKVRNLLTEKLNIDLAVGVLFEFSTIESLRNYIENKHPFLISNQTETVSNNQLSEEQKGMWYLQKLYPNLPIYNISIPLIVQKINKKKLKEAFQTILRRHTVLNMIVEEVADQIYTKLYQGLLPYREIKSEVNKEFIQQEARRLFDLTLEPPVRLLCCDIDADNCLVQWTFHHFGVDRVSFPLFFRELNELLESVAQVKEQPTQYAEYINWQQSQRTQSNQNLNFWKKYLKDAPTLLRLPMDQQRRENPSLQLSKHSIILEASLTHAIKAFAKENQTTPFLVLLSLFFVLLYRYTHQNDIVIGTPLSMRMRREFEEVIGCFVNTIPVRMHFKSSSSFLDIIKTAKNLFPGLMSHADVPFAKMVQNMHLSTYSNIHPLFQILLVYEEQQNNQLRIGNSVSVPLDCNTLFSNLDLIFAIKEKGLDYEIELQYAEDLFLNNTIFRLLDHFSLISKKIFEHPEKLIAHHELLSMKEKKEILFAWNDRKVDYSKICTHAFFEEQVRLRPDAIALIYEEEMISYHWLNVLANKLSRQLINSGVRLETHVGICMERSIEQIIAALAILKAGGCFIPLDPSFPKERIDYITKETNLKFIITKNSITQEWKNLDLESDSNPNVLISPRNLAYIIYTSGSTGTPKGVLIEHLGLTNLIASKVKAENLHIHAGTRILQLASTTFDASIWDWIGTLSHGSTLIMKDKMHLTPGFPLLETLQNLHINYFNIPAGALELLPQIDLPHLKVMMAIGDVCSKKTLAYWSTKCKLYNGYGPTECTIGCIMNLVNQNTSHREIGQPLPNIESYVLDSAFIPVPVGVEGELLLGGDCLARGYLKDSKLTSQQFIPHPFKESGADACRLYKTGDLVRYNPNGNIEFAGRVDSQYKIRGFRVDTSEIVAVLNQHPKVEKALVTVFEKESNHKLLCAYVSLNPSSADKQDEIILELKQSLKKTVPSFMLPQMIHVIEKIPLTKNGKIEYDKLPNPFNISQQQEPCKEIQDPIEKEVFLSFKHVLNKDVIGLYEDFFDLGGHSLIASQLLFHLNEKFQTNLLLKDLFNAPTIKGLADLLKRYKTNNIQQPIIPHVQKEIFELTNAQKRLWVLEMLLEQKAVYNVPLAFEMKGSLNLQIFQQAINKLIERHENLRLKITTEENVPKQKILPIHHFEMKIQSISIKKGDSLKNICSVLSTKPFQFEVEPLWRCFIIDDGTACIILFVFHHLIVDGQSLNVFIKDLNDFYNQAIKGILQTLSPLQYRYRDYVDFQISSANEEKNTLPKQFWREYLKGYKSLKLPIDYERPVASERFQAGYYQFVLDEELTEKFRKLTHQIKTTLNTTCLSFFQLFLHKITFQSDILIGCPFTVRQSKEWNEVMGYFINSLPIRTQFENVNSFYDLICQVHEDILKIEINKHLPFEQILKEVDTSRSQRANSLIQAWFVLENFGEYNALNLIDTHSNHFSVPQQYAKFDFMLIVIEKEKEFSFIFEYPKELFSEMTVVKWSEFFIELLKQVIDNPKKDLREYALKQTEMSVLL